jgi:alginate O-acetyltransferase complex protein AlgJ
MSALDAPLTAEDVRTLYRDLLERKATPRDVEAQLEGCTTLGRLIDVLLASDEYATRVRARVAAMEGAHPPRANVWHPELARWTHEVGAVSRDGIAIVGHDGWLFVKGGASENLAQHRGENPPSQAWLDAWMATLAVRRTRARELGIDLACVIAPDKIAIEEEHFPEPIEPVGPRPAVRLCEEAGDALRYPLAELRAARREGAVSRRTDTHLSVRGSRVLAEAVTRELGVALPSLEQIGPLHERLDVCDLGVHFTPHITEVIRAVGGYGDARLVDCNYAAFEALRAHVGMRSVLRNPSAPDPRVAVLLGDSYGYPVAHFSGIAWWLAQAFAEVHFLWVPFGWDPGYLRRAGAQVAVLQIAERFLVRVPHDGVDALALARDTISSGRPAGLESFCRAV